MLGTPLAVDMPPPALAGPIQATPRPPPAVGQASNAEQGSAVEAMHPAASPPGELWAVHKASQSLITNTPFVGTCPFPYPTMIPPGASL